MPEGDTIAWHANRLRPALEGHVPDEIRPGRRFAADRWPDRLEDRKIERVETRGKHLLIRFGPLAVQARHDRAARMSSGWFEGDLVLHSHLGMVGSWGVYPPGKRWGRSPRRAWLVLRVGNIEVVQFDGSTLELMTAGRARGDQRLAALGPDILGDEFEAPEFLRRLRLDDPTRPFGDSLLDQRILAGIGNMWKAEGCWEAQVDPWRRASTVSDDEAVAVVEATRPRMQCSAERGPMAIDQRVYGRGGRPCPRCGTRIESRGQWEDNRLTYWCPGCQH